MRVLPHWHTQSIIISRSKAVSSWNRSFTCATTPSNKSQQITHFLLRLLWDSLPHSFPAKERKKNPVLIALSIRVQLVVYKSIGVDQLLWVRLKKGQFLDGRTYPRRLRLWSQRRFPLLRGLVRAHNSGPFNFMLVTSLSPRQCPDSLHFRCRGKHEWVCPFGLTNGELLRGVSSLTFLYSVSGYYVRKSGSYVQNFG